MYICCAKVKCFYQKVGKNVKCALKPLRDERAREMHDDTASRSSCVAVLWAHKINGAEVCDITAPRANIR